MSLSNDQTLNIKDPSFDMHVWEDKLSRLSREKFETTLCIFNASDPQNVDKLMESAHQEVSYERPLQRVSLDT
jgi:hypothetical protein